MTTEEAALRMVTMEARALLGRLARVEPFALNQTSVPAAQISNRAQVGIERLLTRGRRDLQHALHRLLRWLESSPAPSEAQRAFTVVRLKFNAVLSQFDVFADALTQRSEHPTGIWLAGLDAFATDALKLPGYFRPPPVVCYLDRGAGAAIRRARTRLPGGGDSPVAVIRVPRERMVGSGVASSLAHEVGHQAAALLALVQSLRTALRNHAGTGTGPWAFWERWISEIMADLWSVAKVGVGSTVGLMGVVSLPRAFVFRGDFRDPHPIPWIRVKLSCEIGNALHPHPQWSKLASIWETLYPLRHEHADKQRLLARLEGSLPEFLRFLMSHRPPRLDGRSIAEALRLKSRNPDRLLRLYGQHRWEASRLFRMPPALAFAVIGQAKAAGQLSPEEEDVVVARLLKHLALRRFEAATKPVVNANRETHPTKSRRPAARAT